MKNLMKFSWIVLIMATFTLVGCSSQKTKKGGGQDSSSGQSSQVADDGEMVLEEGGDSDSARAGALKTVYFALDSSALTSSAKSTLTNNAKYLKENDDIEIQVEGHCDERGGVQYNLALGERRAKAVKQFLVALGISADRISTVSFGKEKPIAYGHDEEAWSKNRRANFVVTEK